MLASASPEQYAASLKILLDDPNVDAVMLMMAPPPMYTAGAMAKATIPLIHSAKKPGIWAVMGERLIQEAVEHFRASQYPSIASRSVLHLRWLCWQGAPNTWLRRTRPCRSAVKAPASAPAPSSPSTGLSFTNRAPGCRLKPRSGSWRRMASRTLTSRLAATASEAADMAGQIGYPVALKITSPHIAHKSDISGVLLNLSDQQAVVQGYNQIMQHASLIEPPVQVSGVHVQGMVEAGQDVIIGAVQDQQFGPWSCLAQAERKWKA